LSSAINVLNSLSEEYPDDIPVQLQLAFCYEAINQFQKSMECYDRLLLLDSTNTFVEVRKADLLYRAEKYAMALDAYSRIDSTYNPNYLAKSIAMCYEKLNQWQEAKDYYHKAWKLNPQDAFSANSLVKIYLQEEDYLSAHQYSEHFILNDSTNLTMNALNAFTYYKMEFYEAAIQLFEKCLQNGNSAFLVNSSLGLSYHITGLDSLARPLLQQAALQDTLNNNVLFNLGKTNFHLGYYEEAVKCYLKVIDNLIPQDRLISILFVSLAKAYEKNESFHEAIEAYREAIRYTPHNNNRMEIYYAMAVVADEGLKDNDLALNYYKQYRLSLFNYQVSLQEDEQEKIDEVKSKLAALDEYIWRLNEETRE
jgi:tetratricopeptide (TPR) repeat protein